MINIIMDQKNIKLIPAQTGNRITDMWECNERFCQLITDLQTGKTCFSDNDMLNEMIKMSKTFVLS